MSSENPGMYTYAHAYINAHRKCTKDIYAHLCPHTLPKITSVHTPQIQTGTQVQIFGHHTCIYIHATHTSRHLHKHDIVLNTHVNGSHAHGKDSQFTAPTGCGEGKKTSRSQRSNPGPTLHHRISATEPIIPAK